MRPPPKKKKADPVLAADWNLLIDAITARTPCPSAGLELTFTSSGFTYRSRPSASSTPPSCGSFQVFTKVNDGEEQPNLIVGKGVAGKDSIDETDLGSLDSNYGMNIYVKVTLDGTEGTYESEVIAQAEDAEDDDETTHVLIGTVKDKGGINQAACGPISVTVCRNWFASESPYYGITVTTAS